MDVHSISRFLAIAGVESCLIVSFAVDAITTSRSCDTASKKRETNTSCREQKTANQAGDLASERNKRCFARTRVGDTEGSTMLEK